MFQDVSFSYQNAADPLRRMALDHLTIKIPAGSFAALVGPSGGGKSTAGQLIARFWDVESGSITIAGHDIREYSMEALMNAVAFVFQDTHIFAESVYDNIAMHRKVHREDVEKAAKAARCHDFILSLPNGYDTKLGDGGHKLSGGEAQRIAIARAILKDAPIVVLDEAMAFTDAENELALREGMAELLIRQNRPDDRPPALFHSGCGLHLCIGERAAQGTGLTYRAAESKWPVCTSLGDSERNRKLADEGRGFPCLK